MIVSDRQRTVEDILCRLIEIPSVNPMGREVDHDIAFEYRLTDWLERFFRSLGVPCERWDVAPGRPNLVARYDAPHASSTILLDVHQDTVPVDGMTVPPFEPIVQNGRITGRGSADVKGGMAAMLFAFRRLVEERPAGSANVVLSCTCDEEATTLGIRDLVDAWTSGRSKLLPSAPDFAIIAEPTLLDVVVAHRGVLRFRIRTTGVACHSSDPTQGVNAIYRMARVVARLEQYAAALPSSAEPHPLCGAATLSVGRIDGGMSVNIVPDSCTIEIDRRLRPGESFDRAYADIQEVVTRDLDFPVEFEPPWIECPPLSDAFNGSLTRTLLDHIEAVAGTREAIGVPFGTHAAYTSGAGIPSVVFGPGSIAQAHTRDEFIEIDQLQMAAEILFRVCAGPPARRPE
ncbi:Acetylornithine deacetylase [Caulifigura coniformis]|uniref:Acetylornithine deacetylase n=1 Tax=Caulifigura coniformis TaxID=2527983 RepID=A0A517SDL0_9PLAN|nr:M20 family metallopeptidase [Caulifigura coniformis]QDT54210.1 Acetylornithine deacetylase [Caulifigura coniformis]